MYMIDRVMVCSRRISPGRRGGMDLRNYSKRSQKNGRYAFSQVDKLRYTLSENTEMKMLVGLIFNTKIFSDQLRSSLSWSQVEGRETT